MSNKTRIGAALTNKTSSSPVNQFTRYKLNIKALQDTQTNTYKSDSIINPPSTNYYRGLIPSIQFSSNTSWSKPNHQPIETKSIYCMCTHHHTCTTLFRIKDGTWKSEEYGCMQHISILARESLDNIIPSDVAITLVCDKDMLLAIM